ncbi:MAG TPA: non-homologous end-joining DNA ligase, partial [Luteimonas sp.]
AGRVGSGFNNEQIRELTRRIGKAGSAKPTVHVSEAARKEIRGGLWFEPMFVVEVFLRGTGSSGVLRQPSLKALRPDKDVDDLADSDRSSGAKPKAAKSATRKAATTAAKSPTTAAAPPMRLTSPSKIIFPDSHITKLDVADYYLAVMDHLLPEIAGRPISIIRCPQGAGKPCFFQKHYTPGLEHVSLVRLKEEAGNNANYLVAHDAAGVMELVQLNGLEFHPWGSHADNPDVADRVVFDLDPGPNVPWAEVKAAALHVRRLLAQAGLDTFLRTTGGKGLHVVVPLKPGCEWDVVKRFAKGFADALAQSEPQRFLAVSTLKLRPNRIFVDYLRNGRGATAVASYSLRARDRAPVAMPIAWSELKALKRGDAFTLKDVPARLKRRRKDPWAGIGEVKQDLSQWSDG